MLEDWRDASEQALPLVAPVSRALVSVTLVDSAGGTTVLGTDRYRRWCRMARGRSWRRRATCCRWCRPKARSRSCSTPGSARLGRVVPADLQQAVFLLAAQYYETRNDFTGATSGLPYPVTALIERWRTVRVLGRGAA